MHKRLPGNGSKDSRGVHRYEGHRRRLAKAAVGESVTASTVMNISPLAGKSAPLEILVDVSRLITAYYTDAPDPTVPAQRVAFGTSGHRGSSFKQSFNENHILAITQAICLYRKGQGINGPLFSWNRHTRPLDSGFLR